MRHLTSQMSTLRQEGIEVILVSSGAVGAGRALIALSDKVDAVSARQIWAAVGQIPLFQTYKDLFAAHGLHCAQVLATREDFRDRAHYLNMKNCFSALLAHGIVPIVNENDVVSVTELMFTDNDELAGLIASMMNADALVLLTNVDGIYDAPPSDPQARVIPVIEPSILADKVTPKTTSKSSSKAASATSSVLSSITQEKSSFGRGGMLTKYSIARQCASMGMTVHIANGKAQNTLVSLARYAVTGSGERVGTTFLPTKSASSVKRWIAHARGYEKGVVYVNAGAAAKLLAPEKASSLLPVGITKIEGVFEKGDIVKICHADSGETLAFGIARYGSESARHVMGLKQQKPLVHYDYLFIVPTS